MSIIEYLLWCLLALLIVALWFGVPCLIYFLYKVYKGTWYDDNDTDYRRK